MDCAPRSFRPRPPCRLAGLTAGLLTALCFATPVPAQDSVSLETIRAGYIQTLSAIQTLDCRFELVQVRGHNQKSPPENPQGPRIYTHYDVIYRTDGIRFAGLLQLAFAPGETRRRTWTAFDGKTHSSWIERIEPDPARRYTAPRGTLSPERTVPFGLPVSLDTVTGKEFWFEKGQLRDLFTAAVKPVVTPDAVDGVDCLRVDFGEHRGPLTTPQREVRYRTQVWFDPAAGYLPRRVHSEYEDDGKGDFFDIQVTSFLMIKDPLSGGELPLPAAARHERPTVTAESKLTYEFKLLTATVNQELPAALFTPDFPQGTKVTDRAKVGKSRTWLVGSPELREQLEARERATMPQLGATTPEQAALKKAGLTTPRLASDHWYSSRPFWLAMAGILVLTTAFGVWKYKFHS